MDVRWWEQKLSDICKCVGMKIGRVEVKVVLDAQDPGRESTTIFGKVNYQQILIILVKLPNEKAHGYSRPNHLRTMASETVAQIDWSVPPTFNMTVPLKRHLHRGNVCHKSACLGQEMYSAP